MKIKLTSVYVDAQDKALPFKGDYERIKARGAEFTMPSTDVTASTIATLNDTCGNRIQLTHLHRVLGPGTHRGKSARQPRHALRVRLSRA